MKKYLILSLTTLLLLTSIQSASAESETYKITPDTSIVKWTGEKVTGSHHGTLAVKSGEALIENGTLIGGQFELAMNTIKDLDIEDPKFNKKLTDHLHSEDFFNVENYPVVTFKITNAKKHDTNSTGEPNYTIEGDLSIKGITVPISFPALVMISSNEASARAETKVDRTKFNIRYGSGKFFENLGDKLIYDEFKVELEIASKKA